jgi:hypothetical protein
MEREKRTTPKEDARLVRAPKIILLKMSLPKLSVPNICLEETDCSRSDERISKGSYGEMIGANTPKNIIRAMNTVANNVTFL